MFVSPLRQEDPRVAQDDPRSHWDGSATEAGSKLEEVSERRRERRVGYQSSPVVVSGNAMPNRLRSPTSPGAIERNNVVILNLEGRVIGDEKTDPRDLIE